MKACNNRIVITGLGVVSPIGSGVNKFWRSLIKGTSGIEKTKSFDTSLYKTHQGAEVKNFNPRRYIHKVSLPSCCRSTQLALAATRLAVDDAKLSNSFLKKNKARIGAIIGSTTIDPKMTEGYILSWVKKGFKNMPKTLLGNYCFTTGLANAVADEFGIEGISISLPAACAAGNYAIGYAFDLLKAQKLDLVFAGGSDPMNQLVYGGFNRLLALDPYTSRPFDLNRRGLIVGEGSGILVLETLNSARKRKAKIYAEILGYGLACDAYHVTGLHPQGLGIIAAIRSALKNAQVRAGEVGYINAHGTATILNDRIETKAIKKVFGKYAKKIPVSSIKSMIGHTMGAASAIEAIACALVVKEGLIPPTINYKDVDPQCDLDYVPNVSRRKKVNIALSNSFGFGGNIAALLIGKFNG